MRSPPSLWDKWLSDGTEAAVSSGDVNLSDVMTAVTRFLLPKSKQINHPLHWVTYSNKIMRVYLQLCVIAA